MIINHKNNERSDVKPKPKVSASNKPHNERSKVTPKPKVSETNKNK